MSRTIDTPLQMYAMAGFEPRGRLVALKRQKFVRAALSAQAWLFRRHPPRFTFTDARAGSELQQCKVTRECLSF